MKILFFGAGVLGSLYAVRLKEAGHDVSILARGQRLKEISSHGIILQHAFSDKRTITQVDVVESLQHSDHYDWIIVLVRKNQVDDALNIIASNHTSHNVLVMVNNPSGYADWIETIGREKLVVGFAGAGGTIENGIVKYALAPGFFQPTTLAEVDGRETARLIEVVQAFKQAGFSTVTSPNMDAWQKTHVSWVSPLANAIYMAEREGTSLSQSRHILKLTVDAIREGYQVLNKLDVPITPPMLMFWKVLPKFFLIEALLVWTKTQHFKTLILRHSLAAKDEMRQIAAEFAALSATTGVSTPALDSLR